MYEYSSGPEYIDYKDENDDDKATMVGGGETFMILTQVRSASPCKNGVGSVAAVHASTMNVNNAGNFKENEQENEKENIDLSSVMKF